MKNTLITKLSRPALIAAAVLIPQITAAQGFFGETSVTGFLDSVQEVINALIPILSGLALLAFFWGLAKYVFQADDEDARKEGKKIMIAGIVALFLMAAIGGIIEFLTNAAGTGQGEGVNVQNPIQ